MEISWLIADYPSFFLGMAFMLLILSICNYLVGLGKEFCRWCKKKKEGDP
ncbi:MAG: hypothetical protein ACXABY_10785 [Candidatus Thorarchaeota archaeon]|jgi:hypothetical protein